MKWEKPSGSVQHSTCGNYCIMKANTQDWVAYRLSVFGSTAEKLGERHDDEAARACCELDEHRRVEEKRA